MRGRVLLLVAVATGAVSIGPGAGASRAGAVTCDLTLKFGSRSDAPPRQFHLDLVVVNTGSASTTACRVSGFPAVELIGPVAPGFGSTYLVSDRAGRAETVTLRPGQAAHAILTWLPATSSIGRWVPGYLRVVVSTNRGPSVAMELPWRYGSVLRQDAATRPGTYVGPVRSGAR